MPKLFQCNLERCWQAQHLLVKQLSELQTNICAISEPRCVPKSPHWFGSINNLAAIYWESSSQADTCRLIYRARDFVAVKYNDLYIISCYLSPNIHRADVQDALDELRDVIGNLGQKILICGDFNGKSILWGGAFTCPRGQLLEDWAAEFDLCLLNEGSIPTCVRPQGCSIVDVTWCTPDLRGEVSSWKVREDIESLSDHQYITMNIGRGSGLAPRPSGPSRSRWPRGEWNMDAFRAVALWEFGRPGLDQDASVE